MKLAQDEKHREFVCWSKEAHTSALRVELSERDFYVFPYSRLQWARFEHGDPDELQLRLDTHLVQITGQNLRDLGWAIQKLAVEWVRPLSARYTVTTNAETVCISHIEVSEVVVPET